MIKKIKIYDNIKNDPIVKIANKLISNESIDNVELESDYFTLQSMLINNYPKGEYIGTLWQAYIAKLVANATNVFSKSCEEEKSIDHLNHLVQSDIQIIKELYNFDWKTLAIKYKDNNSAMVIECEGINRLLIHESLQKECNNSFEGLKTYYKKMGYGIFEAYDAFKWDNGLVGINAIDTISVDDLIGYEHQKEAIIENTKFLVDGMKANNVLLYGDRGTGKSSSVKAVFNLYKTEKLKIIELAKEQFIDFGKILDEIRDRGHKFIIFIDDLSFEDFETDYKHFKAVLEGGLEVRPQNVVIYVTTNRRNIIKENWKDQMGAQGDEIHISDSVQEKLSLADRFGLTITYPAPDKQLYLSIVKEKAKLYNIPVNEMQLEEEALIWEMRNHGKSGRAATQFIDYMRSKYR